MGGEGYITILYNTDPAYFLRRWLRRTIAVKFKRTTTVINTQGRDIDHWLGCFHIGRLKAHVVNMKSQVHELSIEVEKGPGTVYGE